MLLHFFDVACCCIFVGSDLSPACTSWTPCQLSSPSWASTPSCPMSTLPHPAPRVCPPFTVLPVNLSGATVNEQASQGTQYGTTLLYFSMSNIPDGSGLYWCVAVVRHCGTAGRGTNESVDSGLWCEVHPAASSYVYAHPSNVLQPYCPPASRTASPSRPGRSTLQGLGT